MNEQAIYEPNRTFVQPQVEVGTVSWNDGSDHYDLGDPNGADGERHTIVKVTLFRGRNQPFVRGPTGAPTATKFSPGSRTTSRGSRRRAPSST